MIVDGLLRELDDVRSEMSGINPALSTYKKLKARETEILEKLSKRTALSQFRSSEV